MATSTPTETDLQRLPHDVLDAAVDGISIHIPSDDVPPTLRDQLDPAGNTLLIFLRHTGCIFCREMVKDVRTAADQADALPTSGDGSKRYPRVVFVHQGDSEAGAAFFGRYWPGVCAVSDPDRRLYHGVGLGRGSITQMFGPRVWACGLRATFKGHGVGRPVGDPWTMPGVFLVDPQGTIVDAYRCEHAGDHPDFHRFVTAPPVPA